MQKITHAKYPKIPIIKLKCFQITKLQSVAKLNPIKLKIILEYNSILNITLKKKATQKITKTEGKKFRMKGFFLGGGDFFPRDFSLER